MTANFLTYAQVNPENANRWRKQRQEALAKTTEDVEQLNTFSTNNRVANHQRTLRQSRRRTKR